MYLHFQRFGHFLTNLKNPWITWSFFFFFFLFLNQLLLLYPVYNDLWLLFQRFGHFLTMILLTIHIAWPRPNTSTPGATEAFLHICPPGQGPDGSSDHTWTCQPSIVTEWLWCSCFESGSEWWPRNSPCPTKILLIELKPLEGTRDLPPRCTSPNNLATIRFGFVLFGLRGSNLNRLKKSRLKPNRYKKFKLKPNGFIDSQTFKPLNC